MHNEHKHTSPNAMVANIYMYIIEHALKSTEDQYSEQTVRENL